VVLTSHSCNFSRRFVKFARGVIEAHGGRLVLSNHPEGGLNAVVHLPAA